MADKVHFGLSRVKYALYNAADGTFGTMKDFPGAVSFSLSREGGDASDFYADNGIYYTFSGTNGGYSADLEMAAVTDQVMQDLLGELVDTTSGLQYEVTQAEPPQFALVFETQGDVNPTAFTFYNCKASRVERTSNTKNDSPDVDTETLAIRMAGLDITVNNETKTLVQSHIEKTAENTAKYNAVFASVVIPGA